MTFHNSFIKGVSLCILGCASLFSAFAQPNQVLADAREKNLKNVSTPSDSIKVLLDVYNLSDKVNRDRIRVQIINLAQRSDNNEVIENVLQELASSTDDTQELARLIEISENLPEDSSTRDNIRTVLVMEKADAEASHIDDSLVERQIADDFRQGFGYGTDPYKEIQNIYRAMTYLGASSQGPLYFEYIKRLEDLVNRLPDEDHAIKNLYYTTAAIYYTRKRDYKKAIQLDKQLISQLDELSSYYKNDPVKLNELDYFYYVSYRRMLRNFKGLNPEEIENVYNKCVELAQRNERAAQEFDNGGLTNSYYFMATKQYAKAVPELKKALNQEGISDFRKSELLGHLGYALRMTGDKEGELVTLRQYAQMLLKDRVARRNDMYREIELRNSVNKLITDEYQKQQKQRESNRVMRKTSITLVYVLGVILIFMCQAYFRLRREVKDLETGNSRLRRNLEDIFDDGVPKGAQDVRHRNHGLKG